MSELHHHCGLYSSWEMSLNTRVEVKVDANVDGLMDEQTGGKPDPYIALC